MKSGKKRRLTIADIASRAGVSKATVSRVISNPALVKAETKKKIRAMMDRYDYIPNNLAAGLAGNPTRTIGVVIDELSNFFFIEIAEGIDRVISSAGYSMLLSSSRWIQERETGLVRSMISSWVDGVLLAPVSPESESINMLKRAGIPFVLIDCIPDSDAISFVATDNFRGGQIAADYINRHKREQTIIITGYEHQTVNSRMAGLKDTLHPSITFRHYTDVKTMEEGYNLVPLLLEKEKIATVSTMLFVTNDNVAIGIINRLREYKIRIPEQVSIMGYDNIKISGLCGVPLTTVSQPIFDMGRIAAMELLDMMAGNSTTPRRHIIQPELVERESTTSP
ncbi:MAG: LacI family transcriptional regulator [Treponema sp.]|jgi:DNA-binding LacI/PurR family transcriptional regulator|nr:LacI family transcriptional regulator [Treponema sp.]